MRRICVFCGSKAGGREVYADHARRFGAALVRRGLGLVYGAGHVGLMGVVADAVLQAGGEVIGVIPQALVDKELAHSQLTDLRIVRTMHERKAMMAELADGFAALPGGYGTGDELFEILTWAQLGFHRKPIGVVNVGGYFDGLLAWLDHTVAEQFVKPPHRRLLLVAQDADELLDQFESHATSSAEQPWIEKVDL